MLEIVKEAQASVPTHKVLWVGEFVPQVVDRLGNLLYDLLKATCLGKVAVRVEGAMPPGPETRIRWWADAHLEGAQVVVVFGDNSDLYSVLDAVKDRVDRGHEAPQVYCGATDEENTFYWVRLY